MSSEIFSYEIKEKNETYSLEYFLKNKYLVIHVSTGEGSSSDPKIEYEQKYSLQSLVDINQTFRIYEQIEEVPEFLKTLLEEDKINLETKENSVYITLHTYIGKLKEPVLVIPEKEQDYSNFVKDFTKNLELLKSQFSEENSSLRKELGTLRQENSSLKNDLKNMKNSLEKQVNSMKQDSINLKSSINQLNKSNANNEDFYKMQDDIDALLNWKENHLKEFKKVKDTLSDELDENKKEDDDLKKRVEQLENNLEIYEKNMKKLEDENAELKKKLTELEKQIKESKNVEEREPLKDNRIAFKSAQKRKKYESNVNPSSNYNIEEDIPKLQENVKILSNKIESIVAYNEEREKKSEEKFKKQQKEIEDTREELNKKAKESNTNMRALIDNTNDQMVNVKQDIKELKVKVDPESVNNSMASNRKNNDPYEIDFNTIYNWISPNKKIKKKLLYKATRDGDKAIIFHSLCDNRGPTLSVIITENGAICGGYTSKSWDGSYNYRCDRDAFIFSLDKKKKVSPKDGNYAIYCSSNEGPSFGWGDLSLCDQFFEHENNHNQSYYYNFNTGELVGNKGNKNFLVREVEVYQIAISDN